MTNLAIVILLLVSIGVSLSSDFNDFINEAEDQHVKNSIAQLTKTYQINNSWQPIINDVQIWRDIVDPRKDPPPPRQEQNKHPPRKNQSVEGFESNFRNQRPPPNADKRIRGHKPAQGSRPKPRPAPPAKKREDPADFLKTGRRMSLYDMNESVIVGREFLNDHPRIEPIISNGETIGWIGLVPSNAIKDSPASDFLRQQYKTYYIIACAVLILSVFMAILLAKHLIAPIKLLINGTGKLRNGDYAARVNKVSKDEIGLLSDNFNDLANTLEKNQTNRHQWISDTSHELRTPLTVIKSQLIAIQDGIFEATSDRVDLFIDEINKLGRIVDDLYQLSSSDVGGLTYKKSNIDPMQLLLHTLNNYQSKFLQQKLKVTHNITDTSRCTIVADKTRLLQLFSNLIENSCRYTDSGGKINIITTLKKNELSIQINDSFPGVSKENQAKIFERFYRVEQSRSRIYGGSGLGLALCSQIVIAHQGTINTQDSALGGLSININLPLNLGA